jgi:hypothetical protein
VVYIGDEAFFWNDSLVEIDIPDRITYIGSGAFYDNSSLKRVVIGRGITKISDHAFYGCQILSKVVIAGKIQTIGESAFADCYKLVQINIPDGTTEIGDYAFYSCAHMPHIVIPESVTKIGARAFGCSEDGNYDVCIYSNQNTEAERYAINYALKFYNISGLGSGRMIRYDLLRVPQEKIKTLTTGKKQISLSYKKVEQASYRIAVKKAGTSTWKKYTASKASAVIKGLQSGKQYKVKVRAVQNIVGIKAYGKWSAVKTVTVQ